MKNIGRIAAVCLMAVAAWTAGAQSLKIARIGETSGSGDIRYVMPATTVVVDVTVKHDRVLSGEYARYAQKYLGVIAPLSDRDTYTIESAAIQWYDTDTPAQTELAPVAGRSYESSVHTEPGNEFMRVLPDKVSVAARNAEDAARDAAETIYSIRKRRLELVMGDVGENVYGEGLRAAIERLDRIENEYLELFLGKQSSVTYTERFRVVPEAGKSAYVVCRLNQAKGLVPTGDLSGEPLLLEIRAEGLARRSYPAAEPQEKKGSRGGTSASGAEYMVADMASCTVTDGKSVFAAATIPVYQMGVRVNR